MVRRITESEADPIDRDERLGEAIEAYLALTEAGQAPEPSSFANGYPDLEEDLVEAIEGLALVRGLVGEPCGPGHRLESGRRVAGYRIVRELGRGGMGIVYEAVHVGLDRPVALKVLGSSAAPDSSGRRRFLNEARTAAGLHHTHIVPVFDVGQVGGLCYYAMQRIEGSGLDRVIRHLRRDRSTAAGSTYPGRVMTPHPGALQAHELSATGPWNDATESWNNGRTPGLPGHGRDLDDDEPTPFEPPRGSGYYRWVASVGKQASEALAHAHQRGVIHRDVKPSNLLVDARGTVWMADFGLARRLADPSQTQVDSLLGTPRYMSPEQAKTGPIDGRSDVYSLGATLYELLTLRPPFEGRTAAELIDQIAGREPSTPRSFDPRVPRDLETIVLKALHKRAADRYATASELSEDLARYLNHEPVRARRIGPIGRAWRVARRHPSLTIVSTVATAAVIASSTVAYVRVLEERDEARKANSQLQTTTAKLKTANEALEAADRAKDAALSEAFVLYAREVRVSQTAERRSAGLDWLKKAAALTSGPAERARLRDEAVAFLAIRDVEGRGSVPLEARERLHGLAFGPDGRHLAILSDDQELESVRFFDMETRTPVATHRLGIVMAPTMRPSSPSSSPPQRNGGRGMGGMGGMGGFPRPGSRLIAAGPDVAVALPEGRGIRLLNPATGDLTEELHFHDGPGPREWAMTGLAAAPLADRAGASAALLRSSVGPERLIVSIAASANGSRFVTLDRPAEEDGRGSRNGRPDPNIQIHLWEAKNTARPLATFPVPESVGIPRSSFSAPLVAISPDGTTVAVALMNEPEIQLWTHDGLTHTVVDSASEIRALAIGPGGLLAAAGNRAVHLWDLARHNASLPALTPGFGVVNQIRFDRDSGSLVALTGGPNAGVELWDAATTTRVASFPGSDDLGSMSLALENRTLAIGLPSTLSLWAVVDPLTLEDQVAGFSSRPRSLGFSPAGELAMAGDGEIRRWSPGTGHTPARVVDAPAVRAISLAFDAQGLLLAQEADRLAWLSADDKVVREVDLPSPFGFGRSETRQGFPPMPVPGRNEPRLGNNIPPGADRIARSADGRTLAMVRGAEILLGRLRDEGETASVVPLKSPDLTALARSSGPPGRNRVFRDIALSPDGGRLFLATPEGIIGWAIRGERLERLWTFPGKNPCMALSPDGRTLAIGDRAGALLLVEPADGRIRRRLDTAGGDATTSIGSLAFSPDGSELAVGSREQATPSRSVDSAIRDGSELAVGSRGQVRLWAVVGDAPRPLVRLPGHRGLVTFLAYDPHGDLLATGGDDNAVKVWDLARVRRELALLGLDCKRH